MRTNILRYRIIINKEGGQYVAYVPILGISDFGKTIDEAKKHVEDAIACHIEGLIKTGDDVPAPDVSERRHNLFSVLYSNHENAYIPNDY